MNPIVRTALLTAALIAIGTTAWSADKPWLGFRFLTAPY